MRRALKYLFAFLVLVVVAVGAALFLIPREQIVALAADQVRAATGRELVLTGDLAPSFWPVLGVRTGQVRLSNAGWAETPDMISASAAEIGVELVPLFSGEVKVTTLRLVDPVVALEIGRDGVPNWAFGDDGTVAQGGGGAGGARELPKIALPEAVITNGRVTFSDARSGQRIELASLDLTAGLAGIDAPLRLDGSGVWNGERAEISALVDTPAAAMEGRPVKLRLELASKPATIRFDGDLALAEGAALPVVNGDLAADLPGVAAAMAWATGAAAPAALRDIGAIRVDGRVSATDAALALTAKGSAGYKGRTIGFDVKADGGAGWLDRQAFSVALAARSEGLFDMTFSGPVAAGAAPSAEGPLKLSVPDLRGLAEWASGAPLDTPAGSFESADLEARLALRGGDRVELAGLSMRVDQTTLGGEAAVNLGGARPMVTARLDSGPLDLSPFMAGGGGGGGAAAAGWSTEPLDLSALRSVDADVAIRAEAVDLGQIEIGRSDIAARLRDGRLDIDIRRVDAYGGGMNGTVVVVAGEATRVATDLTISQVQLRPLLNALAGVDNLEGLGAFRIRADGQGRSMDALMRSLDGQGGLELTDGAILGLNLAAIVRNLTGQGGGAQRTDFTAVSGTFDITDGVLHNTDFSFLGPLLRVVGAGTVDLGRQTQNFRLEPTAVASLTGQGGAIGDTGLGVFPILITGSWSNPSIRPDLTAAITGLLADPNRTVETVTGIVRDADPGKAAGVILDTVTGGAEPGSPAGTLGQVLGGVLQGDRQPSGGDVGGGDGSGGGLGGLLGTLGGGRSRDGGAGGGTAVGQPTYGGGASGQGAAGGSLPAPGLDASEFAPLAAPLPRPAPDYRSAAIEGGAAPSVEPEPVPQAGLGGLLERLGAEPETVRQPTLTAPGSEPAPALEPAGKATEPQPATEAQAQPGAGISQGQGQGNRDAGTGARRKKDRDGGLILDQILKGLQK